MRISMQKMHEKIPDNGTFRKQDGALWIRMPVDSKMVYLRSPDDSLSSYKYLTNLLRFYKDLTCKELSRKHKNIFKIVNMYLINYISNVSKVPWNILVFLFLFNIKQP